MHRTPNRWHKQLLPRFARHPDTGEVDGVGSKVFPSPILVDGLKAEQLAPHMPIHPGALMPLPLTYG